MTPGRQRLARGQRLKERRDFTRVMGSGQRVQTRLYRAYAKPGLEPRARLGIVVSKRVIAKATARNRIKRLVREAFRSQQVSLGALDMVVLARGTECGHARQAFAELTELFSRLRVLA